MARSVLGESVTGDERVIFSLSDLLDSARGARLFPSGASHSPDYPVNHLACHTKDIVAGESLFAAVRGGGPWYVGGERGFDYHEHIPKAINEGATALLVEDLSAVPDGSTVPVVVVPNVIEALGQLTGHLLARHGVAVTAVTGSTGKTSTCEIAYHVLGRSYDTYKFISNRATPISVPRNVLNAGVGHMQRLIMEMPMDGLGQITTLCGITPPTVGVVVNINNSHIVQLGSIENITDAKAELVEALPASGTAVLNFDDPRVRSFDRRTAARVVGVGTSAGATLVAEEIVVSTSGVEFVLTHGSETARVRFPVPTRLAVNNALLGAGVGIAAGLGLEEVVAGVESFRSLPGRMNPLRGRGGFALLDNSMLAVPQSTELMLAQALEVPCRGRRVLAQGIIYGTWQHGEVRNDAYHLMSQFDEVYLTGPETREHAEALRNAGMASARWHETPEETAAAILEVVQPDDFILVNGNEGSETVVSHLVESDEDVRLVDDAIRATM